MISRPVNGNATNTTPENKKPLISRPLITSVTKTNSVPRAENNRMQNTSIAPLRQPIVGPASRPVQLQQARPSMRPSAAPAPVQRPTLRTPAGNVQRIAPQAEKAPKKGLKFNKNYIYLAAGVVVIVIIIIAMVSHSAAVKRVEEQNVIEVSFIEKAKALYEKEKDSQSALDKYNEFLVKFKGSQYSNQVKEAIEIIEAQVTKQKESKFKWTGLKQKIKSVSSKEYPELATEVKNYIREYPNSEYAAEANKILTNDMDRIVAQELSDRESKLATEALIEAESLRNKKEFDKAIAVLENFLKKNRNINDREEKRMRNQIDSLKKEKEGNS